MVHTALPIDKIGPRGPVRGHPVPGTCLSKEGNHETPERRFDDRRSRYRTYDAGTDGFRRQRGSLAAAVGAYRPVVAVGFLDTGYSGYKSQWRHDKHKSRIRYHRGLLYGWPTRSYMVPGRGSLPIPDTPITPTPPKRTSSVPTDRVL